MKAGTLITVLVVLALTRPVQQSKDNSTATKKNNAEATSKALTPRDYYKELYDAGGFKNTAPNDHVCFSDDPASQGFLTIGGVAYDQAYSSAFAELVRVAADPKKIAEYNKAQSTVQLIQASAPYIGFVSDDLFQQAFPQEVQDFLRRGGRFLVVNWYSRGVKNGSEEYHWDGKSAWVYEAQKEDVGVQQHFVYKFLIEPETLRYVLFVTVTYAQDDMHATPAAKTLQSGRCEKISPEKPQ